MEPETILNSSAAKRDSNDVDEVPEDRERSILPAMGAFVVFTIDPIASLDPDTIEDPEAIAACKQLVNKQYVALAQRKEFYRPWDPYNECIVDFVLQGEQRASPDRCMHMEPSMTIPVVPTTVEHPLSRIPLVPSSPLPWKDCYVSCLFAARVRSRTQFTEDPIGWRLAEEELDKQSRFLVEDMARKHDLAQETSSSVISDAPNELLPNADADPNAATVNANEGQVNALPEHVSLVTAEDEDENELDSVDVFESAFLSPQAPQGMITVNFSHDLSIVKELNDPDDYFREVAAINQ
ncbi:hypothetical protein DFH06DRAFT_1002595 [Mycena polygramma]|nr:hypothetical protein DFH06DRAFT_1002595 [Mycena polygramma]